MSKKPYIYEGYEWLEIIKKKSWWDDKHNPDDLAEYSEFNKPYLDERGKHSYPSWEWTWPGMVWPPIDDITYPDPVPNPCSIDEDCVWAGVIGPDTMECGQCFTWSQAHLWLGCGDAPWWAAYGSWKLEPNIVDGECYFLFSGPVMATVCCDDGASGSFILTYEGALNCSGGVEVTVSCDDCCEDMELTGADSVNAGSTWTGTITTACPNAICTVTSNSGCTLSCNLNELGSEVTVTPGGGDCGGFTVEVKLEAAGVCPETTVSKFVKINGGSWAHDAACGGGAVSPCSSACSNGCGGIGEQIVYADWCYQGEYKYGGWNPGGNHCEGNWTTQCRHIAGEGTCTPSGSQPPCMSKSPGACGECRYWGWWRCNYVCEC